MATTYGKSPGGWLWAIVEPIAAIALLAFAFSLAFAAPPLGDNFALFYATGYLPYIFFADVSQKIATSLRFSKSLMSFGAVTYLDAIIARVILNCLTQFLVFSLVMFGLLIYDSGGAQPDYDFIGVTLLSVAVLALGVGTLNCYLFTAFPAWERLWAIVMRPLFIISGVIFLFEDVPENLQLYLGLNPLFHVTGAMRQAFFLSYHPEYVSLTYVFGLSTGLFLLGLMLLDRFHDELIHK